MRVSSFVVVFGGLVSLSLSLSLAACGGETTPPPGVDGGPGADFGGGGTDARVLCTSDVDCNDGLFCNGREMCAPASASADVRGCVPGDAPCSASETCDETANDCRTTCEDVDGDGHEAVACGGDDCDDTDASRYPGNAEVCNTSDEDCNDATLGFVDADGDGVASSACCNGTACGGDCNDGNADVRPGALDGPPDLCNTLDDDCDGSVDEGCPCTTGTETPCYTGAESTRGVGRCADGFQLCVGGMLQLTCNNQRLPDTEICDTIDNDCDGMTDEDVLRRYYRDGDADGFGLPTETIEACSPPAGFVSASNDCADDNANINPGAFDGCNMLDDDCDGMTDEGAPPRIFHADADGDGFGAVTGLPAACDPPAGSVVDGTDCDDTNSAIHPGAFERCDAPVPPATTSVNDDCDGSTNEGCACIDGATVVCGTSMVGICRRGTQTCVSGRLAACAGNVEPAASETCNGRDDNCNGTTDEGVSTTCYADADDDGHGAGLASQLCGPSIGVCPAGWSTLSDDCNDSNGTITPGTVERCNARDDDCDGAADDGFLCVLGGLRSGTGTFAACTMAGSVPGVYSCDGTCMTETFTASPPPEICDARDNNCNGVADDGFACRSGATGIGCTTRCGTPGTQTCSAGCAVGVCNGSEVCNGCDDDGDGVRDQTLTCIRDTVRSCTTACGTTGSQRCLGDCSGYDACRAAIETCNACDDDLDGAVDDGFTCEQSRVYSCTTAVCGTAGQLVCNATCSGYTAAQCAAPSEYCNYCDDDKDGTYSDDRSLATGFRQIEPGCPGLTMVSTIEACPLIAPGGGPELRTMLNGTANDAAAIWMPAQRLGWGTMRIDAEMNLSKAAGALPADGWAVVLADDGGPAIVGGIGGALGVPYTRTGLAIEWRFYNTNPGIDQVDTIIVRRLTGVAPGMVLSGTLAVPLPAAALAADFGAADTTLTQNLIVFYTPDDPTTFALEERLRVEILGTTIVNLGPLAADLTATSMVTPGITASTGGQVFTAEASFGTDLIIGGGVRSTTLEFYETCD